MLSRSLNRPCQISVKNGLKNLMTSASIKSAKATELNIGNEAKLESVRMRKFHQKLRADRLPASGKNMRFMDLVLVETDPKSGELISDSEKEPTKWGDWQQGGRVSDF